MSNTVSRGPSNSLATFYTKPNKLIARPLLDESRVISGLGKYILDVDYLGELLSNGTAICIANPLISGQQLDLACKPFKQLYNIF